MLQEINDTSKDTVRQWLLFMLERVGHNHLPGLLDYYENIGWISDKAASRLIDLADEEKRFNGPSWKLSCEEHRTSMLFIEKISGRRMDGPHLTSLSKRESRDSTNIKDDRPRAGHLEAVQSKKESFDSAVQRREVTIKNLEQELEKRDIEIGKLHERIEELEGQLALCRVEARRNSIYTDILGENLKLRKVEQRKNWKNM